MGATAGSASCLFVLGAALGLCCCVQISSDSGGGAALRLPCAGLAVVTVWSTDVHLGSVLAVATQAQGLLSGHVGSSSPDPGANPCPLHGQSVFSITGPPGKSRKSTLKSRFMNG